MSGSLKAWGCTSIADSDGDFVHLMPRLSEREQSEKKESNQFRRTSWSLLSLLDETKKNRKKERTEYKL